MVFNETEQQEREYLQWLIGAVEDAIGQADGSVRDHVDTLQEYKDYLWSNKDIDPHEIRSMRESILNHFALGESVIDRRRRLSRVLNVPYFGRIDFREEKEVEEVVPIYVGVHTFYDSRCRMNLIYDWRAPISGMFYDCELGQAFYRCPSGEVRGDISLKRQYRIRDGRMEYMIESSLTVHDDVLQKELSSTTDDRMRNIVATIQREQNRIIRNEEAQVLIIQGVAGSGKTSIALHRIAYLLYALKGEVLSKDILIVSPNRVFADYISNVLPELGEEAVPEVTMEQILSRTLGHKYRFQTFFEQVAELLDDPAVEFIERIRYKASFDFVAQLDRFVLYVENHYFKAVDVRLTKQVTVSAEFIDEQFRRFGRYPMRQRFEAMTDYILEIMAVRYRCSVTAAERRELKKQIGKMFAGNDDFQLYRDFFEWVGKPSMFQVRRGRMLEYADLGGLAYLHMALDGVAVRSEVKHLLIDEMQDYTPMQYRVIQRLYACRKTILGDASQSVNPYGSSTANMVQGVFVTGEVMKLCKSYRSTFEITALAQRIRVNEELEPIERHGERPRMLRFRSEEEEVAGVVDLVAAFRVSGYKSLGIVCKTESQAREFAERLRSFANDVCFLSNQSSAFANGVVVVLAHMAKGLEFDEVVVPQANRVNYCSEIDRSMLYVAVTRAMHRLVLTCCGMATEFVEGAMGE